MPFRDRFDCLWCGTAARDPHARRPRGLGAAVSDLPRQGGHQPVPAHAPAARRSRSAGRAPTQRRPPTPRAARRRRRDGAGGRTAAARPVAAARAPPTRVPRVPRRLVPPPRRLRARRDPRHRLGGGARRRHPLARRRSPLAGRIDEPAAGTGFFSPLLADKGELHASDEDGAALDIARDRLVAHRLRAHLHVADPWTPSPSRAGRRGSSRASSPGRVRGAGLDRAVAVAPRPPRDRRPPRAHRPPARPTRAARPAGIAWTWHDPALLEAALARAGFSGIELTPTGRFFLLVTAEAA